MVKLVEGRNYEFTVVKEALSPDGFKHYIFSGPDKKKYLVPHSRYADYKISVGSRIICRVDKINCMGKVFLEPQNPFFIEGETYLLEILEHSLEKDRKGRIRKIMKVTDANGNKINVYPGKEVLPDIGSKVYLTIRKISKGKVYLGDSNGQGVARP